VRIDFSDHQMVYAVVCGQNAAMLIAKAGGIYSYHWTLKD
jgi:hypothetical protein